MAFAWEGGIRQFDTAQTYGDSEQVLGQIMQDTGIYEQAHVISKLDPKIDLLDSSRVRKAVEETVSRIGCPVLHGLMLHRELELEFWDRGLGRTLLELVENGLIRHVGVSVYTPEYALRALETEGIDIIQLPSNMFDRRFESAGIFDIAAEKNVTVYVRSVFLQGLVLMGKEELPEQFYSCLPYIESAEALAREFGVDRGGLALGFAKKAYPEANIVFGAETPDQVRLNLSYWAKQYSEEMVVRIRKEFEHVPESICNPLLWPSGSALRTQTSIPDVNDEKLERR